MEDKLKNIDFKATITLPKTDFAMKANLNVLEPSILFLWEDIYKELNNPKDEKVSLLWGPPFANGHLHMGTSLNGILKDILMKTKRMQGFNASLTPIWDCHGLPIEWKVEESFGKLEPIQMIEKCREFANKWIGIQKSEFKRLGILADFDKSVQTMDKDFEALVVNQIFHMLMSGQIRRGLKPVLWSVVEKTALAEAEVEYHDHESTAIFVSFKIENGRFEGTSVVIWTTTPWTLPSNRAVAYNNDFDYVLVCVDLKKFWIAKDLLDSFLSNISYDEFEIISEVKGSEFLETFCSHPIHDFKVPLIPSNHVTSDAGTGFVHIAPSHGMEDFELGNKFNLEVPEYVNDDGFYSDNVPLFKGLHIFKVTDKMLESLNDNLITSYKIKHSYPHSWRSRAPLIYRATSQWFIDLSEIKEKALDAIEDVTWHPKISKNRIKSMVENRNEWCLSRQRTWGVPIPFFVNKKTGEVLKDNKLNGKIVSIIKQNGIEGWRSYAKEDILKGFDYNPNDYEQVFDIVDVWFESGCVHLLNPLVDYYLEGSDQHRGWFQSSLLVSIANQDFAPYKNVITHGFVLDGKERKMSKSLGNTINPKDLVEKKGADIIRLWVANSNYFEDICISDEILAQQEDMYRKFRNVLRYLLGAVEEFDISEPEYLNSNEFELDRYILSLMYKLDTEKDTLSFYEFFEKLHNFCAFDLSAFYFDIKKDTLYCDLKTSKKRIVAQFVLIKILHWFIHVLAPVLSFTAEEAWLSLLKKFNKQESFNKSIHLNKFIKLPSHFYNKELLEKFDLIRKIKKNVTILLEKLRSEKIIGSSLQAHIDFYTTDKHFMQSIDFSEICIVSSFTVHDLDPNSLKSDKTKIDDTLYVSVSLASGQKCPRCWKISGNELCNRCEEIINSLSS